MLGSFTVPSSAPAHKRAAGQKRKAAILVAAALALAAIVVALVALTQCSRQDDDMEPNVIVGTMEGYSDEEIAAMLAKQVDEGMIAFSLNTAMYFESPTAQTSVKFENPPNNAKLTKLRLVRDDTGEQIYETGYLAPGSYVDDAAFDVQLEPGTYTCTGYVSSYHQETKRYLGEAACTVTVTVAG